jgi:DNA-directed RNA polymerase specialized sigma24 family protein
MHDQTTTASAHEVMAVEPVIRRVVAARAANSADIDDLVQDCLERLLVARGRLAPEAVLPYAVVTARNLVSSHAKTASRRAAAAPRAGRRRTRTARRRPARRGGPRGHDGRAGPAA